MKNISNIKIENNHIICRINNTKLCYPWANVTGCLFNQLVYCMAIFTTKQVKIFTFIYYIMPIPCTYMVNSIE